MPFPVGRPHPLLRTAPLAALALAVVVAPASAQRVATGAMTVRVTVLETVRPIALAEPAERPQVVRDPVTGRYQLRMTLASEAPIEARLGESSAAAPRARIVSGADTTRWSVRVDLPAAIGSASDTVEVRLTSRTGEAETTVIARVPAELVPALRPRVIARAVGLAADARSLTDTQY